MSDVATVTRRQLDAASDILAKDEVYLALEREAVRIDRSDYYYTDKQLDALGEVEGRLRAREVELGIARHRGWPYLT